MRQVVTAEGLPQENAQETATDTPRVPLWQTLLPYAVFGIALTGEQYFTGAMMWLADHLRVSELLFSTVVFGAIALAASWWELRATKVGQPVARHDQLLRASGWLRQHFGLTGLLVSTVFLGSMFTTVEIKRSNHRPVRLLSYVSAIIYTLLWIPAFAWLWSRFLGF